MTQADSLERQMLALINAERAQVGAGALQLELNLNQAAQNHSLWMIATDTFSHTGVGNSNPGDRIDDAGFDFSGGHGWAENIASRTIRAPAGFGDEVEGLHNQLMNSTGHRQNLLNDAYDYIGIGIEIGEYEGRTWAFVTQKFAYTGGSVDLDPGSGGAGASANASGGGGGSNASSQYIASGIKPASITTTVQALEYIASYGDLIEVFGADAEAGTAHYNAHGIGEGRSITFDAMDYIASYDDLMVAFGAAAETGAAHYINHGRDERRVTTFDGMEYVASYADLSDAFGADGDAGAAHFIFHGQSEKRSASFDGLQYIASYVDLIQAFGADSDAGAAHYINHGRTEGRSHTAFDVENYLARNNDLHERFGDDLDAALAYYITTGYTDALG
ncbi:MAG: CAP domain-containing protein [Pseudomonadota bacterium]